MNQVLQYIAGNESRFIAELCEYISIPSVSAQPQHRADVIAASDWLVQHCKHIGLAAEKMPTTGNSVVVAKAPPARGPKKPHFLVYGHYDVQPPEPFDSWQTAPFQPRIQGNKIFGRGASDNKGQHFAHLKAVEAYLKTGTELPCNITFIIEGEEEVGSPSLAPFLKNHRREFLSDGVVISDNTLPALNLPALTYALRGIVAMQLTVTGPSRDLHAGIFGGCVENPAMALCRLLAQLHDEHGRISIPRFYDDVEVLTTFERQQMARFPMTERKFRKFLGVPELFGEKGYTSLERRSARPTLEINGLTSGYQGEGSKTIVPAWARAKLTLRLVPHQTPGSVADKVSEFLRKKCPASVRLQVEHSHGGVPYCMPPESPLAQAAMRALKLGFGHEPILFREGGSIPIVSEFKEILGVDSLMLGLALDGDGAHSPNENFDLRAFSMGMKTSAYLWQKLAEQQ